MEILLAIAIAYALGGGITAGRTTAQQHTKKTLAKEPGSIDRTETGRRVAQSAINGVAKVYTFTSGAAEGWRKAWPETKQTITDRRAKVKADRADRKAEAEAEAAIVDAEIVEDDDPVNTTGPAVPDPADEAVKASRAAAGPDPAAPGGAARAAASVTVTVVTDPPPPPHPPTIPTPAATVAEPAPAPARAPGATGPVPVPGPRLRLVKDDVVAPRPGAITPPATDATPAGTAVAGSTARRSAAMSTNLPAYSFGSVEVTGVDTLQLWLLQMRSWADLEMEDAQAAIARLADLLSKAEDAYNAATAAKYDAQTLAELAAITEQLALLKSAREQDLTSSELVSHNAALSESNVRIRHGAINEAVAAAPVDMAESTTYGD